MNYELKSVKTSGVFFYSVLIFPILGFILGVLSYWILPNPNVVPWLKIAEPFIFTLLYTVVLSLVFSLMAFLYNMWAQKHTGIKFHFEQAEE